MEPQQEMETKTAPKEKRKTGLRRQTVATIVLSGLLVLLIVAQIIASGIVKTYTLKDRFLDENGVQQIVKYTVKRDPRSGLYALYNKKGEKMELAPESGEGSSTYAVYQTEVGGNQYRINTATGDFSLYAAVDTEGDEVVDSATGTRLLMFPYISESEFSSLEVQNASGKFRVQTIRGAASSSTVLSLWSDGAWVETYAKIDSQSLSGLRVNCGYTLTQAKLDLSAGAALCQDGSVNYAVYGLDPNAENPPAVYTIASTTGKSYTVLVGNLTVNGEGYYVKRADRDAVYIIDTYLSVVLSSVEDLVTPTAFYALGETTYPMVENFFLMKVLRLDTESEEIESDIITAFSYRDLSLREYTLYQTTPYVIPEDVTLLRGYTIDDWQISDLLSRLYRIQYLSCKKLMPSFEDLADYGLTENFHYMTFYYNVGAGTDSSAPYVHNIVSISQKTYDEELGQEVCYLYTPAPAATESASLYEWGGDMIVAVDPYYFSFVEWEQSDWYNSYYFQTDLAFLRELHLTFGEKQYDFYLDNGKSNQKNGLSSENLEVYCTQYDSPDHKLDYEVHTAEQSDIGAQTAVDYTGAKNFKRFISKLFLGTIEGDVNQAHFLASTGKTVEEFIAADTADDQCIAKIRYHLEDYAAECNPYWDQNNNRDIVLRFYEYESSGRKYLMTVEVLERDENGELIRDESGEVLTDATRAVGLFYVNAASLRDYAGYAEDLLNKVLIPQ